MLNKYKSFIHIGFVTKHQPISNMGVALLAPQVDMTSHRSIAVEEHLPIA